MDEVFKAGTGGERVTDDVLWQLTNHAGSVRDIVDANGTLRKQTYYDSFGDLAFAPQYFAKDGSSISASHAEAVDQLFYFQGRALDKDTGLYDFGSRPYDPKTARFLSEDSIGLAGGDANFYRFEGNDPIDNLDPTGHSLLKPTQVVGTLGAFGIGAGYLGLGTSTALGATSSYIAGHTPTYAAPKDPILAQADAYFRQHTTTSYQDIVAGISYARLKEQEDYAGSLSGVHDKYFGDLYRQSHEGQAAARAQRDANYEQHIRTRSGPVETGVAETIGAFDRFANQIGSGIAYPFNLAEDTAGLIATGKSKDRTASLRLDVGNGGTYLQNVAYVGTEYFKEASQYNKAAAAYNYATDPSLDNGRVLQAQALNAAVQLYGLRTGLSEKTSPSGIQWIDEIQTKYGLAQDYEDAAFGARSNVSTGLRQAPALPYNNPNPNGSNFVKFDGIDPYDPKVMIDRKLNVTTHSGQLDQLRRQARVLEQNPGYQLRIEVPTPRVAKAAGKALDKAGLQGAPISIRVVPHQ